MGKGLEKFSPEGLILCVKYSYPPNKLGFCGPQNSILKKYLFGKKPDKALVKILTRFEAVYPYLKLIAKSSKITDPFSPKVIEAYWLGNKILNKISSPALSKFVYKTFGKYLSKTDTTNTWDNISKKAVSCHLFHILVVFSKTGGVRKMNPVTLDVINQCRISWGRVIKITDSFLASSRQFKYRNQDIEYTVETRSLAVSESKKIVLGKKMQKKIRGFEKNVKIGNWVSFHWQFLCEVLNKDKLTNLKKYTKQILSIDNLML